MIYRRKGGNKGGKGLWLFSSSVLVLTNYLIDTERKERGEAEKDEGDVGPLFLYHRDNFTLAQRLFPVCEVYVTLPSSGLTLQCL